MKKTIIIFLTYLLFIPIIISLIFNKNEILANLLTILMQIIFIFLIYKDSLLKDFKNFKPKYILTALKMWILEFITLITLNIIIISIVGETSSNETAQRSFLFAYPILSILTTGILGPISEELAFRKNFKEGFKSEKTFLIISSLIFGLAHLITAFTNNTIYNNPLQLLFIIPYTSMGYFFAKAYLKTDNILTSTIMHITHNIVTLLIILGG